MCPVTMNVSLNPTLNDFQTLVQENKTSKQDMLKQDKLVHTGGISLGSSTSLVKLSSPFFSGHLRSACSIVSHASRSWLINVISPYLTWRCILEPWPTSSLKSPDALIANLAPLDGR